MKIAVIGAGSWGTTLANLLAEKGEQVLLWAFEPEVADNINRDHQNQLYLPGIALDERLEARSDLASVAESADLAVMVCPSHVTRGILENLSPHLTRGVIVVNASKGLESKTFLRLSQVEKEVLPARLEAGHVTLSGPSFALEVARRRPTVITAASENADAAECVQQLFSTAYLRVYTHHDVVGVELGGALKNVIALATGIIEGAGLGFNTRAALITRGLAEITRLGVVLGAQTVTFSGISGLGDLVLTCTGELSRNRQVGLRIGQGESLGQITGSLRTVAEGIRTTESAYGLASKHSVEMPITGQVYRILFQGLSVGRALDELMNRELKTEYE